MKTGKKYYLKNYDFHEILTCLSHGYKNIGQNNILSLIKVYFNGMWTMILFIINQRYNHYISSCIPWETILKRNWLLCVSFFREKFFYHDIWSLPNLGLIYPSPKRRLSGKTICWKVGLNHFLIGHEARSIATIPQQFSCVNHLMSAMPSGGKFGSHA
jgi:hypothetical protein